MRYQEKIKSVNLSIEQLKEEKRQIIIENHKPEIVMTMNQLIFQKEDFQDESQNLIDNMEDSRCLLRTMRQFTEDDALELLRSEYQKNCIKMEKLFNEQSKILDAYINQINVYINK